MRKWHRWVSLFAGVFMLWMSITGLIIHVTQVVGTDHKGAPRAAQAVAGAAPAFVCPPDYMCRPKPKGGKLPIGVLISHLHSGEALGPIGRTLSILAGFSLLFFTISGIWMYVQMWRFRDSRGLKPRWLWK